MYQESLPNLEAAVKEFKKNITALSKVKSVDQISQYEMAALSALHTAQLSVGGLAYILQDAAQRARVNANQIATAELLNTVKQSTTSASTPSDTEKLPKKSKAKKATTKRKTSKKSA